MKFKKLFKNPVKGVKDTFEDIRNPGKKIKGDFKALKKDITNPKEALSDRWENFKENPGASIRPSVRGPFSDPRYGNEEQTRGEKMGDRIGNFAGGLAGIPPKNTRLSPGVYADGRGGQVLSMVAPGPVDTEAVFNAVANGAGAPGAGQSYDPLLPPGQMRNFDKPSTGSMLGDIPDGARYDENGNYTLPDGRVINDLVYRYPPGQRPQLGEGFGIVAPKPGADWTVPLDPGAGDRYRAAHPDAVNKGGQLGRYAPGAMPQNTRGDAMRQPTPPRGTRLSPGVYADGRGGSYRSASGR